MTGRNLQNNVTILLFGLACLLFLPAMIHAAGGDQPVAILVSDEEQAYSGPIENLRAEIGLPVEIYNLKGDLERAPEIMSRIIRKRPQLVFALGAKAAVVSKIWTADHPEIPVIFAMVINWQRYNLTDQDNIAGIGHDVAAGTHLASLSMVSPAARTVGIVYSGEHSREYVESARRAAAILNLELVEKVIEKPREFQRFFKSMEDEIDSFWILPDPVVYTLKNISWLEKRCVRERIICLGPSENIARHGVLLSIDPDRKNIGVQAASIAKSILNYGQQPDSIGVMPPLGTRLFINLETADRIGLQVNRSALDQATEVIGK